MQVDPRICDLMNATSGHFILQVRQLSIPTPDSKNAKGSQHQTFPCLLKRNVTQNMFGSWWFFPTPFEKSAQVKLGSSWGNRDDNLKKMFETTTQFCTSMRSSIITKQPAKAPSSSKSPHIPSNPRTNVVIFFPTDGGGPHGWNIGWTQAKIGVFTTTPKKMNEGALKIKAFFEKETWSEPTINLPTILLMAIIWRSPGGIGSWPSHLQGFSTIPSAGFLNLGGASPG